MTFKHRNINDMYFSMSEIYNKAQKIAFLFYAKN